MESFFADNSITVKDVPFGLPAAKKPTLEDVAQVNKELVESFDFTLPEDYINFCVANGGGTLGRVKMFVLVSIWIILIIF